MSEENNETSHLGAKDIGSARDARSGKEATPEKEDRRTRNPTASTNGTTPVRRFDWERALQNSPDLIAGARRGTDETSRAITWLVLLVVAQRLGLDGKGYVSVAWLSEKLHMHERIVRRHLKWATDHGWLHRESKGVRGRASVYVLTLPDSYVSANEDAPQDSQKSANQEGSESGNNGHKRTPGSPNKRTPGSPHSSPKSLADLKGGQETEDSDAHERPPQGSGSGADDKAAAVALLVEKTGYGSDVCDTWLTERIEALEKPCRDVLGFTRHLVTRKQLPTQPAGAARPTAPGMAIDEQIAAIKAGKTKKVTF